MTQTHVCCATAWTKCTSACNPELVHRSSIWYQNVIYMQDSACMMFTCRHVCMRDTVCIIIDFFGWILSNACSEQVMKVVAFQPDLKNTRGLVSQPEGSIYPSIRPCMWHNQSSGAGLGLRWVLLGFRVAGTWTWELIARAHTQRAAEPVSLQTVSVCVIMPTVR